MPNRLTYSNPFGSPMPTRSWSDPNSKYKYGFNGKELDKADEGMGGGGSTYDYGFRIYNPNLGRFLSVDPLSKSYPWYTPYQFAGNMPIVAIDLDGLEEFVVISKPDPIYPLLMVTTIYRIKPEERQTANINGVATTNHIQYQTYDAAGNRTTENLVEFKDVEKNLMNEGIDAYKDNDPDKVKSCVPKKIAMDFHGLNSDGTIKENETRSSGYSLSPNIHLSNCSFFKISVTILFNSDKTTFDNVGLVDLEAATNQINTIVNIVENYAGKTRNPNFKGFLKKYNVKIFGGHDISPSNYNNGCGNKCLAKDRAKTIEKQLNRKGITKTTSTGKDNTTSTTVNDADRKIDIIIIK